WYFITAALMQQGFKDGTIEKYVKKRQYNDRAGIFFSALKMSDFKKEIVRTIYFQRTPEQVVKFGCKNKNV
ncbi:MAG TPA: hypothetical protein VL325_08595, partial [Pyrinomonadaceae bacterium]|nr:hypothetical protein [Pyrinomonadaceae bacterium]